jgi:membrane protease YdiL (CAAX protease family)
MIETLLVFFSIFSINLFGPEFELNTVYIINYIIISLPQAILVVYLISLRKQESPDNTVSSQLKEYGVIVFKPVHIIYTIIIYCTVFILSSSLIYLIKIMPVDLIKNAGPQSELNVPVPMLLLFSIVTGYKEEVFFRSYLLQSYMSRGVGYSSIVLASTCLFALLHFYGGIVSVLIAMINGFVFCYAFKKIKSLHVIALAHALYNFTVLVLQL